MEFPAAWDSIPVRHGAQLAAGGASALPAAAPNARKRARRQDPRPADAAARETNAQDISSVIGDATSQNMGALKRSVAAELESEKAHELVLQNIDKGCDEASGRAMRLVNKVSQNLSRLITMSSYRDVFANTGADPHELALNLRPLSKAFEDSMLRQPMHAGERPCSRGEQCECMFLDHTCPFVGVELVLPWEAHTGSGSGERFCLPCLRATTLVLYLDLLHNGADCAGLVQRYYNEHSKPGEYGLHAMLVASPGGPVRNLPMPIVRHKRSNYHVHKLNGVIYARQVNVDFH